jgi:hypothetical protein
MIAPIASRLIGSCVHESRLLIGSKKKHYVAAPPNTDSSFLRIQACRRSWSVNERYVSTVTAFFPNCLINASFSFVERPSSTFRTRTTAWAILVVAKSSGVAMTFSKTSVSRLIEACMPIRATASETSASVSAANFAEEDVDRVPALPFELLFASDCCPEKEEVMALLDFFFF